MENQFQEITDLLAAGWTKQAIANKLGVSRGTLRYWIDMGRIPINNAEKPPLCPHCGENNRDNFYFNTKGHWQRYRCKQCARTKRTECIKKRKQDAVDYKGGKCEKCGYDKCLAAMEFHHRCSTQKDSKWGAIRKWPIEKLKKELDKCDLLCCRCHREIHHEEDSGG
jgi:hypothetical protein